MSPRDRGPRWSSPRKADRGRPGRMVYLPRDLHAALDWMREAKVNVSAISEEALRAHPKVAEQLAALAARPEIDGMLARGLIPCASCDASGHDQVRYRLGSGLVDCKACHGRRHR